MKNHFYSYNQGNMPKTNTIIRRFVLIINQQLKQIVFLGIVTNLFQHIDRKEKYHPAIKPDGI